MVDKTMNTAPWYVAPTVEVVSISTKVHILQSSLSSNTNLDPWDNGSDSIHGFGDGE